MTAKELSEELARIGRELDKLSKQDHDYLDVVRLAANRVWDAATRVAVDNAKANKE